MIELMKKLSSFLLVFVGIATMIMAQDATEETYSDEDLTKYATVMKWAKEQQGSLSSRVSDSLTIWIGEYEGFTASLYNSFSKAASIDEVEATDELKEAYKAIAARLDAKTETLKAEFKETYVTKIKEDIGAGLYNNLKKALKADADLKARYDSIMDSLDSEEESTEETSSDS